MKAFLFLYLIFLLFGQALSAQSYLKLEQAIEEEYSTSLTFRLKQNDLNIWFKQDLYPFDWQSITFSLSYKDLFRYGPLSAKGLYSLATPGYSWSVFRESPDMIINPNSRNTLNQGGLISLGTWKLWVQKTTSQWNMALQWDPDLLSCILRASYNLEEINPLEEAWYDYETNNPEQLYHFLSRSKGALWGLTPAAGFSFSPYGYPGAIFLLQGKWLFGSISLDQLIQYSTEQYRCSKAELLGIMFLEETQLYGTLPNDFRFKVTLSSEITKEKIPEGEWGLQLEQGRKSPYFYCISFYGEWQQSFSWLSLMFRHRGNNSLLQWEVKSRWKKQEEIDLTLTLGSENDFWVLGSHFLWDNSYHYDWVDFTLSPGAWDLGIRYYIEEVQGELWVKWSW